MKPRTGSWFLGLSWKETIRESKIGGVGQLNTSMQIPRVLLLCGYKKLKAPLHALWGMQPADPPYIQTYQSCFS